MYPAFKKSYDDIAPTELIVAVEQEIDLLIPVFLRFRTQGY
jgi:hypothetical protein